MGGMERIVLKNKQMPLHYQIADYLLNMFKSSETPAGGKLPSEESLREMFGVSRATVRHALDHLAKQGMIAKKQGKGNFWTDASSGIRKEKQSGINRQIFQISEKTTVKSVKKEIVRAPSAVCGFLGLDKDTAVYRFTRLRYLNNEPLSYAINYLPVIYGEKILQKHLRRMMMLEVLENVIGLALGIIEHEVEINRADELIAAGLGIAPLDPVLTVRTSVYDSGHNPVEIVWTYFVENKYKFKVVLDK